MKQTLLLGSVCVAFTLRCFSQTPPSNDDFASRAVLTGSTIDFSGTLAGATLEPNEYAGDDLTETFGATSSVWWRWTAPQSSLVTVEMVGASADTAADDSSSEGLAIYDTTNVFTQAQPITGMGLDLTILCNAVTFSAIAGSNYQFQLLGSTPTAYQFLLLATNNPVILQEPRDWTVSSNQSMLFTVVAEGYRPLSYQWQCAGTNLPGQTAPMLALTNIEGSQAGSYSVIVTNTGGSVTSSPAVLRVSSSVVQPSLTAVSDQSGQFAFGLSGEIGRNYRIESSVDLVTWANEYSFSRHPAYSLVADSDSPVLTSVVFTTNSSSIFVLSNAVPAKFLRAEQYQAANEICINNLRQVRFAKALWLRDDKIAPARFDTPAGTDITPYLLQSALPVCPFDPEASFINSYVAGINNCATTPTCYIVPATHILEEPQ